MSHDVPEEKPKQEKKSVAEKLFKRMPKMTSDYEQLVRYTGSYLSKSMVVAYNKGLNDALKLIMKEETTNEPKT